MCAIWVTLGPRAVIIYFKFIFLINVASAGAVIDVSPLVGMFNDQKSPWRAIIQLILLLPGIAESTMSQRQVHVHLFKLRLNDGVSELSGFLRSQSFHIITDSSNNLGHSYNVFVFSMKSEWIPRQPLQGYLWTDAL